jgi:hypothetical protein
MFARRLNVLMNGGALATTAAIVLVVATACHDDVPEPPVYVITAVARGANVIPVTTDTASTASVDLSLSGNGLLVYRYSITIAPSEPIDSIALYDVAAGDTLPASATAILCEGVAACAAGFGHVTIVAPATFAKIMTSIRAYGTQLVFFTTTAQKASGGSMRGTMYMYP